MEEILKEILQEIKEIKASNKDLEKGQNKLEKGQIKLANDLGELTKSHNKLTKEVASIKDILIKGAYVDIQKLEKRVEVLEKKVI